MSFEIHEEKFKQLLTDAFGSAPAGDFAAWQMRYPDVIHHLNPVLTANRRNRRRLTMRLIKVFSIAACVFVAVWWVNSDAADNHAFAEVLQGIENVKSMTWKKTYYERVTSADGKRSWLAPETREMAYLEPGLYRETSRDLAGKVQWVIITDAVHHQQLRIDPQKREATLTMIAASRDPRGPFAWVGDAFNEHSLEFVGQRQTNRGKVNVFRTRFYDDYNKRPQSYDFWIDAKTKQLVRVRVPGADLFDPETDSDRLNKPEKEWSHGEIPGAEDHDIIYHANLERSLFSLEPPRGYSTNMKKRPVVTEEEMIEFLGALARFNDGIFPDSHLGLGGDSAAFNKASLKDKNDRTAAEQRLIDLHSKYLMAGLNKLPVLHFIEDKTVAGSFRYIGKGAPFGAANRLVCWYKLKKTGKYRAVYADLTVQDVTPDELPLPVAP